MNFVQRVLFVLILTWASVAGAVPASPVSAALPIPCLWSGLTDKSGEPLAMGKVYFYQAGTHIAKTVWDTPTKMPGGARTFVTLDAYGRAKVYGDMTDMCRYKLEVLDADNAPMYEIDGLEVVSTVAPPTFQPGYLNTPRADIASLSVSGRAWLANTIMNGAAISNATCTFLDISNSWLHDTSLEDCGLNGDFDAATYTIFNLGPPTTPQDAARLVEVTTLNASTSLAIQTLATSTAASFTQVAALNATQAIQIASLTASYTALTPVIASLTTANGYGGLKLASATYDMHNSTSYIATLTGAILDSVTLTNITTATQTVILSSLIVVQNTAAGSSFPNGNVMKGYAEILVGAVAIQQGSFDNRNLGGGAPNRVSMPITLLGVDYLSPGVTKTYSVNVVAEYGLSILVGSDAPPTSGCLKTLVF